MPRKKTPDNNKPLSVEQARGKVAKAVRDLVAVNDPGPITFRLKRTRKADETYPLRLTRQQRESMIHATRIKYKVKERLKAVGDGPQVVGFTWKELDHLNDELGQAALYAPGPDKKRLVAVLHKVTGTRSRAEGDKCADRVLRAAQNRRRNRSRAEGDKHADDAPPAARRVRRTSAPKVGHDAGQAADGPASRGEAFLYPVPGGN